MSPLVFSNSVRLGWSVLSVQGQIDSKTVPQFQEALDKFFSADNYFAIDLTNVSFMSSAGLRSLLVIHNKVSSRGNSLYFVGINVRHKAWSFRSCSFSFSNEVNFFSFLM